MPKIKSDTGDKKLLTPSAVGSLGSTKRVTLKGRSPLVLFSLAILIMSQPWLISVSHEHRIAFIAPELRERRTFLNTRRSKIHFLILRRESVKTLPGSRMCIIWRAGGFRLALTIILSFHGKKTYTVAKE
jgi:hypothetical protein